MDYSENQDSGYIRGVGRTHEGAFWRLVMFLDLSSGLHECSHCDKP